MTSEKDSIGMSVTYLPSMPVVFLW